jgi:hypothetical protein
VLRGPGKEHPKDFNGFHVECASKISGHVAGRPSLNRNGGKTRRPPCQPSLERAVSFLILSASYELKSVEFSTKFPSLNLPFVRTDPFFNKPFPFIGLALGGVFGRDGLHEPVDHIGFDQIVRESGMLVVDSFD